MAIWNLCGLEFPSWYKKMHQKGGREGGHFNGNVNLLILILTSKCHELICIFVGVIRYYPESRNRFSGNMSFPVLSSNRRGSRRGTKIPAVLEVLALICLPPTQHTASADSSSLIEPRYSLKAMNRRPSPSSLSLPASSSLSVLPNNVTLPSHIPHTHIYIHLEAPK